MICNETHRFLVPSSCSAPACGRRRSCSSRRAAAPRRRSRSPRCTPSPRRPGAARHAVGPLHRARDAFQQALERGAKAAEQGKHRRLRRAADRARDRLRLHPRGAGRRYIEALRREARRGDGAANTSRRRVPLERRHLRGARLGVDRRDRRLPPRHLQGLRARVPAGQARRRHSCAWTPPRSPSAQPIRSTTR